MSGIPERRAVVFTQQQQDVELCVDGVWWPGAILGWRHDSQGVCEVRVRAVVDGDERETWTGFAELRLPQPVVGEVQAPGAPRDAEPGPCAPPTVMLHREAAGSRLAVDVLAAPGSPTGGAAAPERRRRRRHGGDVTAELPAVRSGGVLGRHRAPAGAGRHRAVDEAPEAPPEPAATASRPEIDCMTRPLRLGDRMPRPRSPRPDGALHA